MTLLAEEIDGSHRTGNPQHEHPRSVSVFHCQRCWIVNGRRRRGADRRIFRVLDDPNNFEKGLSRVIANVLSQCAPAGEKRLFSRDVQNDLPAPGPAVGPTKLASFTYGSAHRTEIIGPTGFCKSGCWSLPGTVIPVIPIAFENGTY